MKAGPENPQHLVSNYRALCAPVLFVIDSDEVSVWQVRGDLPARMIEKTHIDQVPALFEKNLEQWEPHAIHRAKSIGAINPSYQMDFVDIGLLPAIEGETHVKLERMLQEMLLAFHEAPGGSVDPKLLFPLAFRLLAVKVLRDRGHAAAQEWDTSNGPELLRAIENFYGLSTVLDDPAIQASDLVASAWERLSSGISFANISSEDLALVYENVLVTPETRKHFGTHTTPRQLAEYAVARLELSRFPPHELFVYEPFAGAAPFLVSALRHLREALPRDWNDRQRHEFLVEHIAGDELDSFACEVAMLSLILADYPNRNGWRIEERDLFEEAELDSRLEKRNVIVCNPPFQDFNAEEKERYTVAQREYSKPLAVLNAALDKHPLALAFVLPRTFLLGDKFADARKRIEQLYTEIELVALPDNLFGVSQVDSALLIAREPASNGIRDTTLRSTEISERESVEFLKSGKITTQRVLSRPMPDSPSGDLWIPTLKEVWEHLSDFACLGDSFSIHRGIAWYTRQQDRWSTTEQADYRRGLHSARHLLQFIPKDPVWLDCREQYLSGNAISLPWDRPKLIANATRLSRQAWRIAATVDTTGLVCSQQFMGFWPKEPMSAIQLWAVAATLNGPVANAFLADHARGKRFRVTTLNEIPMPQRSLALAGKLTADYLSLVREGDISGRQENKAAELLTQIDAAILDAYDLPLRIERQLLNYFGDEQRPVAHDWPHWADHALVPGLTLGERIARGMQSQGGWFHEVFTPLPKDEAEALREYGE
ncbi:MAG: N-6 DNA methylase [Chloroflexota bacterium]|nr:N-6 DNA methylase [Gammaproteobacteria bacterium]MDE2840729.1 N-6 DNA methylase [Chloroflexota bacterium]